MTERKLLQVSNMPVQQNRVYASPSDARSCVRGNMLLVQNEKTGLIYNSDFDPEIIVYDSDYQNEQANSLIFQEHLQQVALILEKYFRNMKLLEVGCGKGWFLEFLRKKGFDVTGIDSAYEGNSDYVIKEHYSPNLNIHADGIILRHVLEHIQNPVEFLHDIAEANDRSGIIYIEVPCFEWILTNKAWFDIYYEHVNYFRLNDLCQMFGSILNSGKLFGDQYLYIIADLKSLREPERQESDIVSLSNDFWSGLKSAEDIFNENKSKNNIIWGGSSKGVIFCHYLFQKNYFPDFIIDINPAKSNKYIPSSGIKIYHPDDAISLMKDGDNVFVMNFNYINEIKDITNNRFNYIRVDK